MRNIRRIQKWRCISIEDFLNEIPFFLASPAAQKDTIRSKEPFGHQLNHSLVHSYPSSPQNPLLKMKTSFMLLATSLLASTGALAMPHDMSADGVFDVRDDNCFHPSSCSSTWGGKCEDYCDKRGFSHMTGDDCSWPKKKCCCIKK